MKIGILTFHNCSNYGAVLQAYALYKTINNKLGLETEIINYVNVHISNQEQMYNLKKIRSLKDLIRYIMFYKKHLKKKEVFDDFIKQNLVLSKNLYNKGNIEGANNLYDVFIVGSDQVFNLNLTHQDYTYFLNFANKDKCKISYAASMGNYNLKKEHADAFNRHLKNFSEISVREQEAKANLSTRWDISSHVVLDPTFLLNRSEWEDICQPIKTPENYILLYLISPDKHNFDFARKLSKKTKYPIIYINYRPIYSVGMKNIWAASPEQILYLIKNAKYVVTNSFHGTALSINLNKTFFFELSKKIKNGNARIEQIIKLFELEDREIKDGENEFIDTKIKYNKVNSILAIEREKSLGFLKKALKFKEVKDE